MAEKFTVWDPVENLKTEKEIAAYLDAALEEAGEDPVFIAHILGDVARARGMSNPSSELLLK